ncbi:MAG: lytic murein transglycosylase [Sphingomonadaceae bacterium]|nr:lytic murein transglycosylase [Sphingomonadaceae bacterium]
MRSWLMAIAALAGGVAPGSAPEGLAQTLQPGAVAEGASFDPAAAGFPAFVETLRAQALRAGIRPATLDAVLPTLSYNPRVIELDHAQPGQSTSSTPGTINFAPYREKHVTSERIARGRNAYQSVRPQLQRIETETGVPESVMVAIWGNETDYGGFTGNFDLLRSLATLAYDGRRRDLFTAEFIDTLKLLDEGVPREKLKGSWAGATGYPQFLPSMYLRLGKDGDGDGKVDIWSDRADALASIGNYLLHAGWTPGEPWGIAVSVPSTLDRAAIATRLAAPRCPKVFARLSRWMTLAEWKRLGVVPVSASWVDPQRMAALIEPDGPGATAYLTFGNYRAILDYNCSNFYALSVGLLADAVSQ